VGGELVAAFGNEILDHGRSAFSEQLSIFSVTPAAASGYSGANKQTVTPD
jgi:hypothetical protein